MIFIATFKTTSVKQMTKQKSKITENKNVVVFGTVCALLDIPP